MVSPLQYQDWNIRIPKRCVNPSIRKEWRTLTADEKADWISAVKVSLNHKLYRRLYLINLVSVSPIHMATIWLARWQKIHFPLPMMVSITQTHLFSTVSQRSIVFSSLPRATASRL